MDPELPALRTGSERPVVTARHQDPAAQLVDRHFNVLRIPPAPTHSSRYSTALTRSAPPAQVAM